MVVTFICHWDIQPGETQVEPMEGQSDIWFPPLPSVCSMGGKHRRDCNPSLPYPGLHSLMQRRSVS